MDVKFIGLNVIIQLMLEIICGSNIGSSLIKLAMSIIESCCKILLRQ